MATQEMFLYVALGVTALLNWWSVVRGDYVVERLTKPTFMLLLGGLAWSMYADGRPDGTPEITPILIGLGLSLLGDIALLNATNARFMVGLTAFLLAHVAYIYATWTSAGTPGRWWWALLMLPVLLVIHGRWGRDIVRHAGPLRFAVLLYELSLVVLVLVAAWHGDGLVLLGAFIFLVSDTMLGHDRFVRERRWAPAQVMVTYHLAQVLLVVGLLR